MGIACIAMGLSTAPPFSAYTVASQRLTKLINISKSWNSNLALFQGKNNYHKRLRQGAFSNTLDPPVSSPPVSSPPVSSPPVSSPPVSSLPVSSLPASSPPVSSPPASSLPVSSPPSTTTSSAPLQLPVSAKCAVNPAPLVSPAAPTPYSSRNTYPPQPVQNPYPHQYPILTYPWPPHPHFVPPPAPSVQAYPQSRHILCSRLVKHIGQFFLPVQFTLVRSLIPPTLSLAPPTLPFALPILSLSQTVSLSLQFSPTLISLFLQVTGKFLGIYLRSFNLMKPSLVQPTLPHHCLPVRRLNLPT